MEKRFEIPKSASRAAQIDSAAINPEERTIEVSFSSEEPYLRRSLFASYYEVLDHSSNAIDMDWIKSGRAPLLFNHNDSSILGVVESAWVDGKRGKAVIRFSRSTFGDNIFNEVKDRIVQNVSVGYNINDYDIKDEDSDTPTVIVKNWTPLEVSLVSIPADTTVGIGRSDNTLTDLVRNEFNKFILEKVGDTLMSKKENTVPEQTEEVIEQAATRNEPNVQVLVDEAIKADRARHQEIMAMAKKFNKIDLGEQAFRDGKSVDEFRSVLLEKITPTEIGSTVASTNASYTGREVEKYNLINVLEASKTRDYSKIGYELEIAEDWAEKHNREFRGVGIPFEILNAKVGQAIKGGFIPYKRAVTDPSIHNYATDGETTHYLSGLYNESYRPDLFVDVLRNKTLSGSLGIRFLPGLVGQLEYPVKTETAQVGWIGEDEDAPETHVDIVKKQVNATTLAAYTTLSRKLRKHSVPAAEGILLDDVTTAIALELDRVIFHGSGENNQPLGVFNTTGVNTPTGTSITRGFLIDFRTQIDLANALTGSTAWVTSPAVVAAIENTPVATNSDIFLKDPNSNTLMGSPIYASNQILAGQGEDDDEYFIAFGDWSQVWVPTDGAADVYSDVNVRNAQNRYSWFLDVAVHVVRPQAFSIVKNLTLGA